MRLNRRRLIGGLAATGVVAGALAGGGAALASSQPAAPTAAATATATAAPYGWCDDGPGAMDGRWAGQPVIQAAADYLGVTQADLVSKLQSGKSLADLATAAGKSVSGLKDAILAAVTSQVNASTRLSADQKAKLIDEAKSHLDEMVTMTHPAGAGLGRDGSPGRDADSADEEMHGMHQVREMGDMHGMRQFMFGGA